MPLNTDEVLSVVKQVTEQDGMKATVVGVAKGTCIVGACAALGGFLGGPMGLSVGGGVGSVLALMKQKGQYKSVPEIIMVDMTPQQRTQLAKSVGRILSQIDPKDVTMAVVMLSTNASLKHLIIAELTNFFRSEMGYQLMTS